MSKYGVFSGPYFPVFGLNTEIYESQNGCFKKTEHVKFSEKRTFLTPWTFLTRRCACQGVKKCSFFAKLTCFVFLKHPVWDSQISAFSQNTEKYGPGKTPYLDTFHAVQVLKTSGSLTKNTQRLENNNSPKFQRFFLFLRNRIVKLGYCRVLFLSKSLIVC